MYDMLSALKKNGTFLLNCSWDLAALEEKLPASMKRIIAKNNISFYTIDAVHLAKEIGLGGRINTIMQAAFFKLADIIPAQEAVDYLKKAAYKSYKAKGDAIVNMNYAAIDAGADNIVKVSVPASWADAKDAAEVKANDRPDFIKNVVDVMTAQKGDTLPVSAFKGREDGTFPEGTSKYEKRGIAVDVPEWQPDKCIQCNQCSLVCPHAVIRPFLLDEKEKAAAPESFCYKERDETLRRNGTSDAGFRDGLHRLRKLRERLSVQREGSDHEADRDAAGPGRKLGVCFEEGRRQSQPDGQSHRQGQPVPDAVF